MQRFLAIDRGPHHTVRSGEHDRPQRKTKAKPSIIFCVVNRMKLNKVPGEHTLHERHISHRQHVQRSPTSQKMKRSAWTSTLNTLAFLIRPLALSLASTWRAKKAADSRAHGNSEKLCRVLPPMAVAASPVVKHCGKSYPIIISSQLLAQRPHDHRLTTASGPTEKYSVAGQNKRDDCFLLFIQGNCHHDQCDDQGEHTPGQRYSSKTKRSSKRTNLTKERDPLRPK